MGLRTLQVKGTPTGSEEAQKTAENMGVEGKGGKTKGDAKEKGKGEIEDKRAEDKQKGKGEGQGGKGGQPKGGRKPWPYAALEKALFRVLARGGKPGCTVKAEEGWAKLEDLTDELNCTEEEIFEQVRAPRDGWYKFVASHYKNEDTWVGYLEEPFRQGKVEFWPEQEEGQEEGGDKKEPDEDQWGENWSAAGKKGAEEAENQEGEEQPKKQGEDQEGEARAGEAPEGKRRNMSSKKGKRSPGGKDKGRKGRSRRRSRSPSAEEEKKPGGGKKTRSSKGLVRGSDTGKIAMLRAKLEAARAKIKNKEEEVKKYEEGEESSSDEDSFPSAEQLAERGSGSAKDKDKDKGGGEE